MGLDGRAEARDARVLAAAILARPHGEGVHHRGQGAIATANSRAVGPRHPPWLPGPGAALHEVSAYSGSKVAFRRPGGHCRSEANQLKDRP